MDVGRTSVQQRQETKLLRRVEEDECHDAALTKALVNLERFREHAIDSDLGPHALVERSNQGDE